MKIFKTVLVSILIQGSLMSAAEDPKPVIYLQPNTTQLFTELYQAYGLLTPPKRTFFEDALYLDQSTHPSIIPLQPSNQAIFDYASQILSDYHRRVNDLELYIDPKNPNPFFYTAAGSKHLIVALVYAIVTSNPEKKFLFVEEAPFYSGHPNAVSGIFKYSNARFISFHNISEINPEPGEILVEFVTSPNNPDGKFRKPLTDAQIILADFVFASTAFGNEGSGYLEQNIEWIRESRASGKHIFSFNSASKQFGKTGARCGYIWYPLYDSYAASIFKNFFHFISSSTVAGGSTGLADFLNLIQAFLDLPDTGRELRKDAFQTLSMRHELVEKELLRRYPGSTVASIPGSPTLFAKIKDSRIPKKTASDVLFEDVRAAVNNGVPMGETNEFVRLNLCGYSSLLIDFLNRLAKEKKYSMQDVSAISTTICSHRLVVANESSRTSYYANPGDCLVDADAEKGPIEIILPQLIDYESSKVITVKKTDSSNHPVAVKSEIFTKELKQLNETLHIQWSQPFYRNGGWQIISTDDER